MAFTLHVDTGNAAFYATDGDTEVFDPGPELAHILRAQAALIEGGMTKSANVRDANGNRVGSWEITGEDQS